MLPRRARSPVTDWIREPLTAARLLVRSQRRTLLRSRTEVAAQARVSSVGGFQILPETGIGWPGCSGNRRHLTFAIRALMNAHTAGRLSGLCFRPLRSGLESKCRHERLLREIFRYPRDVCGPMFNTGQPHAMRNSAHRLCASAGSEGGFGVSMRGRFPEPLSFGEL